MIQGGGGISNVLECTPLNSTKVILVTQCTIFTLSRNAMTESKELKVKGKGVVVPVELSYDQLIWLTEKLS